MGCNGGNAAWAFNYTKDYPLVSDEDYPYYSGTTEAKGTCDYDASTAITGAESHANVTPSDVTAMKAALAQQPLAVAIQANQLCFQFYSSGVFNNTKCGTSLDHAVTVVGWGNEDN